MTARDFSLSANKSDDIKYRQAILAMENEEDIECLSSVLKMAHCRILGKSQDKAEVSELMRKHKTGLFFLDYDINSLISEEFISSLQINYPDIKVIVLAKTMDKKQLDFVKSHGVSRFLAKPLTTKSIIKLIKGPSF